MRITDTVSSIEKGYPHADIIDLVKPGAFGNGVNVFSGKRFDRAVSGGKIIVYSGHG
jgi:hypothetical protein